MREKIPYTPLSTRLSGSAKETELRLRNIFSGPKKRPPALFLALVFAVCVLCGNLVSCRNKTGYEFAPIYTLDEPRTVLIGGLGDVHVMWSRGTNGGGLDFAGVEFCCPRLANENVKGGAYWLDGKKSILYVYLNVNEDRVQDGTVDDTRISFTVDLNSGTVTQREFTAEIGDGVIELTDQEMLDAAHVLAKLLTEAGDYYNSRVEWLELPDVPDVFVDVLRGESKLVLSKTDPPVFLYEIPAMIDPDDSTMYFQRYTIVNLLGGETPEVLICICDGSGDTVGFLVLADWGDEPVHGYLFDQNNRHGDWRVRWLANLKADGTFACADEFGGEQWRSISYLRLTAAGGWALCSQAVCWTPDDSGHEIPSGSFMTMEGFMIADQELTEEEFEKALEVQRAKPDVTWYEFPFI